MAAYLIPDDGSGRIVTFDVIEAEQHESVAEITDHPVESGSNISDHIRPTPDRLSITAYTSNQPIVANPNTKRGELRSIKIDVPQWEVPIFPPTPGAIFRNLVATVDGSLFGAPDKRATVLAFDSPFDATAETYAILREFQENGALLQIITSIRTYQEMVIERVAAPRTAGDSGVAFGIDFRRIRIVESGQVAAPPVPIDDVPGGKPLENKGGQGAKPPGAGEDKNKGGSIAHRILSSQGLI